jgi:aspartyl-tRNA(Asn)/glutamyl-tRNA(Gln) amidotransferase subunit A
MKTLNQIAADLEAGKTTSRALVEECLAKIKDPAGEGSRTFTKVSGENALVIADLHDQLRKRGAAVSPYAGIPLSVKDLFDVAGDVTTAGSKVFADHAPAKADAPAVARLRAAGFVPVGRTNMVEFAFSALGVNPHYGTPKNPYDRKTGRIPGGSSSGAAVSLSDGMAHAALGTDTGGSCRLPAAMCGLVGFKPTQKRVPLDGCTPLSTTLDSAGPLGRNVEDCAILDSLLAAEPVALLPEVPLAGLRLGVPQTMLLDGLDT